MRPTPPPRRLRRPSFSALPLMLLIWGVILWGMAGCGLLPSNLIGGGSPVDQAREQIDSALKSLVQGDTSSASAALNRAASALTGPGVPPGIAYAYIGDKVTRLGQGAAAAQFLQDALKKPEISWDPQVWSALAEAFESANNIAGAKDARAEAGKRASSILASAGANVSGEAALDAAMRQWAVGLYYTGAGLDTEKGLKALREAYRLEPNDPNILNALGHVLADKGLTPDDFDQAKILTRQALSTEPDNPEFRDSYGWALYKRGDLLGARRVLRETVDSMSDSPDVHYHLGVLYEVLGQASDARLEMDRALQIDPHFPDAADARKRRKELAAYP